MTNLIKLFAVFLIFFSLAGCSRVSREAYDQIKIGMDYRKVVEILGEADSCDSALGAKSCIWGSEQKNITIKFIADKVVLPTMKGL